MKFGIILLIAQIFAYGNCKKDDTKETEKFYDKTLLNLKTLGIKPARIKQVIKYYYSLC